MHFALRASLPLFVLVLVFAIFLLWGRGTRPEGAVVLEPTPGAQAPSYDGRSLRVVSWNIHFGCGPALQDGCNATADEVKGFVRGIGLALREWDADVVALQEVDRAADRTFGIDQLELLREASGLPYAAWTATWDARWVPHPGLSPAGHIGRVYSGQAILSRFPIATARRIDLPQPEANGALYNLFYLHRALLDARLTLGGGRSIRFLNAHLESFDVPNKEEHARLTLEALGSAPAETFLVGDMNSVPAEAALRKGFPDEPETDMSEDRTMEILRRSGLREAVLPEPYVHDERPHLTFPAEAPNRRLDYVFYPAGWEVRAARTAREQLSDHLALVVELAPVGGLGGDLPASAQ